MASFDLDNAIWSAPRGTSAPNHITNAARSTWPRPTTALPSSRSSAFEFAANRNEQFQARFQLPAHEPSYGNQFNPDYQVRTESTSSHLRMTDTNQLQQVIPSHTSFAQYDNSLDGDYATQAQFSPDQVGPGAQSWQAPHLPGAWNAPEMPTAHGSSMMPWNFGHDWSNPTYPHDNMPSLHAAAAGAHHGTMMPNMATGMQDDRPILQRSTNNYSYDEEQGETAGGAGPFDIPSDFDFNFDFGQAGEWVHGSGGGTEKSAATEISDQSNSSAEAPDVVASNYQSNQPAPYYHSYDGAETEDDALGSSYDEEDVMEESEPPANEGSVVEDDSESDDNEPVAPAYTHFATETAAADYSEGKIATVYYKLPIANDDLHSVTDQQARGFCQSIFDALLLPAAAAPAGLDVETYSIQQAKAFEKCKSLMQSADGYKLASSRCALLYYAAVRLHTQGIAKDLLKSICTSTKTNLRLDRTSKFTTRMAKIIRTVSQNKLAAFDVLKDKSHDDFVRGPESYIRRKYTNAKGNANKRVVYTAGKEKLDGGDEEHEAQATQTVNDSGPTVRKTAQGKRKRPNDGEEDYGEKDNGERRRSNRNKRA
ncbi:hypothetical protein LTS10_001604 [Elasticomyces elasticus]|nr:hypothetical protein LTS10_001604 [Elasticomyces elasticus]